MRDVEDIRAGGALTLAQIVVKRAQAQGVMIATAESCTGGMVASALTDVTGASAVFERGFVTYSNEAKIDMLAVSPENLAAYGAVSAAVACEMAQGACTRSAVRLSVAVTGIAGPGGSDHKPEGLVWFATCLDGVVAARDVQFGALGRAKAREAARDEALRLLIDRLTSADHK